MFRLTDVFAKPKPTKTNNIFGYFSVLRKAYFIWIRIILSVMYQILAIFYLIFKL